MTSGNDARPRVIVDCSVTFFSQLKTGVQKTVREIVKNKQHIERHLPGYTLVPVIHHDGQCLTADYYCADGDLPDDITAWTVPFQIRPQDRAFLADSWWHTGVCPPMDRTAFVMYDLIPLRNPEFVGPEDRQEFAHRLGLLARSALGGICISDYVRDDYTRWLQEQGIAGSHVEKATFAGRLSSGSPRPIGGPREPLSFLTVGTIEDRKGQPFILDAFEALWSQGHPHQLHLLGVPQTEPLRDRIDRLVAAGRPLYLHSGLPFSAVEELYRRCQAVICASQAEGFGLPLAEAIDQGAVVMANDIPVFRELGGEYPFYFRYGDLDSFFRAMTAAVAADPADLEAKRPRILDWAQTADEIGQALQRIFARSH